MLPIKLTYLSSDSHITHPAFNDKKHYPDVTDVVVIYSMFYLGYQGVFIGSYSQMKSHFSDNDDDRAGVIPGGSLKGFLKKV